MTEGVSRRLAEFSANLRYEQLPAEIVNEAKRLLLDTIGCGLGGYEVEKGQMAVNFARRPGGVGEATILGVGERVPVGMAAFANGELMNALDWNALLPPSHTPPYVMPSAMALAEAQGRSGKDLIAAVVLGMEVAGRVGTSLGGLRATKGGFPVRVWGISSTQLGATASAGSILGFDADRMQHALGISAYYAPVPSHVKYNYTEEIGYAKYAPSGWVAQGGVTTAQLAEMGYRGDITFLEGDKGFWAMNGAQSWAPEKITDGLGESWVFMNAGYKFWPTCGFYQSPLDAFTRIIEENALQTDEIDEVVYRIEEFASIPKYTTTTPRDHVEAAASGPYNIAVAAHRIPLGPGWQAKSVMENPSIRAFMKKVRHEVNPRSEEMRVQDVEIEKRPYLSHRPAEVIVRARGRVFDLSVDYANWLSMGVDAYRPSDEGLAKKFRANAEIVLPDDKIAAATETIMRLETVPDVSALMQHLVR